MSTATRIVIAWLTVILLAFHVVAQQTGGQSASKIIAVRAGHRMRTLIDSEIRFPSSCNSRAYRSNAFRCYSVIKAFKSPGNYAPWVRARQEQLEADVRRTWPAEKPPEEVHTGCTAEPTRVIPLESRRNIGRRGGSRNIQGR